MHVVRKTFLTCQATHLKRHRSSKDNITRSVGEERRRARTLFLECSVVVVYLILAKG